MNENHQRFCPSPEWATFLQTEVLPPLTTGIDLGSELLEVGPGPGAVTDWLRHRVERLVAVEIEAEAAEKLAARFAGTNVEVLNRDATDLPFPDDSFDSAASFTMLHHVPTVAAQNKLLSEILRTLRPGGVLIAGDSLASDVLHHFHEGDTYNPIEPSGLLSRLQTLGFGKITVTVDDRVTFVAYKPTPMAFEPAPEPTDQQ